MIRTRFLTSAIVRVSAAADLPPTSFSRLFLANVSPAGALSAPILERVRGLAAAEMKHWDDGSPVLPVLGAGHEWLCFGS